MQEHENLRLVRKKLGYESLKDFARKLGYTNERSYSNIEAGRNPVNDTLKLKLSTVFNINVDYLQTGTGNMFNTDTPEKVVESTEILGMQEVLSVLVRNYEKLVQQNGELIKTLNLHATTLSRNSETIYNLTLKASSTDIAGDSEPKKARGGIAL